jgi:hypothetical protein
MRSPDEEAVSPAGPKPPGFPIGHGWRLAVSQSAAIAARFYLQPTAYGLQP